MFHTMNNFASLYEVDLPFYERRLSFYERSLSFYERSLSYNENLVHTMIDAPIMLASYYERLLT